MQNSTAQVPCSCLAQHVATYQVDLTVLKFSSWKVTFPQFPTFSRIFCARRINATRESFFFFSKIRPVRRNNATFLFCGLKRRNKHNTLVLRQLGGAIARISHISYVHMETRVLESTVVLFFVALHAQHSVQQWILVLRQFPVVLEESSMFTSW